MSPHIYSQLKSFGQNHCLDNRNKSQILYCDEIMKLSHQWNKKELPVFVLPKEYSACCRKLSYATSKTPRLSEGYHGLRFILIESCYSNQQATGVSSCI